MTPMATLAALAGAVERYKATVESETTLAALFYSSSCVEDALAQAQAVLAQPESPPCSGCGGPHPFDTSVPSQTWNRVIRDAGLSDNLCMTCIVAAFVKAGEGFTAKLWGEAFNGNGIEVVVRGATGSATVAASGREGVATTDRTTWRVEHYTRLGGGPETDQYLVKNKEGALIAGFKHRSDADAFVQRETPEALATRIVAEAFRSGANVLPFTEKSLRALILRAIQETPR